MCINKLDLAVIAIKALLGIGSTPAPIDSAVELFSAVVILEALQGNANVQPLEVSGAISDAVREAIHTGYNNYAEKI